MQSFSIEPIGIIRSCFTEKFGVPRQSMMIGEARGILKLRPDPRFKDALRHLENFSHVWIVFIFHQHTDQEWRPLITTPRIDAPGKVGVFASRSPHRPNSIGMSAVKLESIHFDSSTGIEIHLSGIDLLDGTPVIDLKPYVPYVDSIPHASGAWTETTIPKYGVSFSEASLEQIKEAELRNDPGLTGNLKTLIEQTLTLDPRPTTQKKSFPIEDPRFNLKPFAYRIFDFDLKWEIRDGGIHILELVKLTSSPEPRS
jgi:tRNA-Thr(GGU) m(6)t(6)A37 methyltransferase TsaA